MMKPEDERKVRTLPKRARMTKLTQDPVVEEDEAPLPRELRRSRFCGGWPGGCCELVLADASSDCAADE